MKRSPITSIVLATILFTPAVGDLAAQQPTLDPALLAGYSWRNLGPDRGGRSIAVSGVKGRPDEAYFGATGGGLWKTTDGGDNWHPVTDFQITSASVGAVAVAETDPDLVFIGTGETCIRGNILPGDGVYRSRDAGETWEHVGFADSHGISKIRIHPTDPDIVYVASFGKYGVPSEGARALQEHRRRGQLGESPLPRRADRLPLTSRWIAHPRTCFTCPCGRHSQGVHDVVGRAGAAECSKRRRRGTRGPRSRAIRGCRKRVSSGGSGVAVSSANSNRVYALFENDNGGLFRSDDAGDTGS